MSIASIVTVFGASIVLEPADGVVMPTPNGLFYARSIRIGRGERVIDIGTGSGVLAVAAAKAGGQVVATDTDPRAVAAAERNAALNSVSIDVAVGALFGPFTGPFEVALTSLAHEQLLALLAVADRYMHVRSRLYIAVHSLSDYHATLRAALDRYSVRLIDFAALPVETPGEESKTYGYVYELTLPERLGHVA